MIDAPSVAFAEHHARTQTHTHTIHTTQPYSNYEKVVTELREGSAVKDAELVELQKQIEKLSSQQ